MDPIKLSEVNIIGFAMENVRGGDMAQILWRASITSNEPVFYTLMDNACNVIAERAMAAGRPVFLNSVASLLMIVHEDQTAELYVNDIPLVMDMLLKDSAEAGQVVKRGSIADIRRVRLHGIQLKSTDKIFYCFKVGWKFALHFDFGEKRVLDIEDLEQSLAHLYRTLSYQDIYDALGNGSLFQRVVELGWFPFIEIVGGPFEQFLKAVKADFVVESERDKLLDKLTVERIDAVARRWWLRPYLSKRQTILEPAIEAFKRGDWVSSIKIAITEIEGIVRDAYIDERGASAPIHQLLEFAAERGIRKADGEATLLFPKQFLIYLRDYTFGKFDPVTGTGSAGSRHTVGHGAAKPDAYTRERALQAILTIDQLGFYL